MCLVHGMYEVSTEHVSYRFQRMIQHHPGTSESHHLAYPFPHVFPIAVGWAFLAGSLLLTVLACGKPLVGVFFRLAALLAKASVALFPAAVQTYHQGYRMLLSFYPIHCLQMI